MGLLERPRWAFYSDIFTEYHSMITEYHGTQVTSLGPLGLGKDQLVQHLRAGAKNTHKNTQKYSLLATNRSRTENGDRFNLNNGY